MKLYATTTSERATKGQGGEYLNIEIKDIEKERVCEIGVNYGGKEADGTPITVITMFYNEHKVILRPNKAQCEPPRIVLPKKSDIYDIADKTKGKKQEGEYVCKKCGLTAIAGTREQTRDFVFRDICIGCNKH